MRARHYAFTPDAAADDSIALAQTLAGAGDFALDGANAAGFGFSVTYNKAQLLPAWELTITAVDDETGVNFTFVYLDANGTQQTATISGPNATTANTGLYAQKVLSVSADAATTDDVSIGHVVVGYGPWKGLPFRRGYPGCTVSVGVGTANYSIEITYANLADNDTFLGAFDCFNHPTLANKAASGYAVMEDRVAGFRIKVNSWSSGEIRMDLAVPMVG